MTDFGDRNHNILMALKHPMRRAILQLMYDGEVFSPSQLAKLLGARLSNVAYHVKVLARCGAVVLAAEEETGGSTQHFYRRSLDEDWAQRMLDEEEKEQKPPPDDSEGES